MVYKIFDKMSAKCTNKSATHTGTGVNHNSEKQQPSEKLHIKQLLENLKNVSFNDSIWDVDLIYTQLSSKNNKYIWFLLCAIDVLSKYACVVSLKDKKRYHNF